MVSKAQLVFNVKIELTQFFVYPCLLSYLWAWNLLVKLIAQVIWCEFNLKPDLPKSIGPNLKLLVLEEDVEMSLLDKIFMVDDVADWTKKQLHLINPCIYQLGLSKA